MLYSYFYSINQHNEKLYPFFSKIGLQSHRSSDTRSAEFVKFPDQNDSVEMSGNKQSNKLCIDKVHIKP